jgi:hypothetical protein
MQGIGSWRVLRSFVHNYQKFCSRGIPDLNRLEQTCLTCTFPVTFRTFDLSHRASLSTNDHVPRNSVNHLAYHKYCSGYSSSSIARRYCLTSGHRSTSLCVISEIPSDHWEPAASGSQSIEAVVGEERCAGERTHRANGQAHSIYRD